MMSVASRGTAPGRVLVIFPGALGDLMLAAPAIAAIVRRHRGSAVELMARAELARFAVARMGVAHGHSIDRREVSRLFSPGHESASDAGEFFAQFARIYSFFAADDSNFRARLTEAAGGPVTFHPFRPPEGGHVSDTYLESIGATDAPVDSSLRPMSEDLDAASEILRRLAVDRERIVLGFPGSGSAAKNWPPSRFAALAEILAPEGRKIVFVIGPAEEPMRGQFAARGLIELGGLELGTLAGLARLVGAFVGNDSGVSHLAAAAGARGVVLFGPTAPARWRPLGRVTVIQREPIRAIEPSEVVAALSAILSRNEADPFPHRSGGVMPAR